MTLPGAGVARKKGESHEKTKLAGRIGNTITAFLVGVMVKCQSYPRFIKHGPEDVANPEV